MPVDGGRLSVTLQLVALFAFLLTTVIVEIYWFYCLCD